MKTSIISEGEVKKIAKLANLKLTPSEVKKLQKQLAETLEYIEILDGLQTSSIKPTSQVSGLTNIDREDNASDCLSQEEALSQTKSVHNGYFKVKSIFG